MKLRSTGLGKTLLKARFGTIEPTSVIPATLEASDNEPTRLLMTMEVVEPVHWTVRAFIEPEDLRRMAKLILTKPSVLFLALRFLFSKSPQEEPEAQVKSESPQEELESQAKS